MTENSTFQEVWVVEELSACFTSSTRNRVVLTSQPALTNWQFNKGSPGVPIGPNGTLRYLKSAPPGHRDSIVLPSADVPHRWPGARETSQKSVGSIAFLLSTDIEGFPQHITFVPRWKTCTRQKKRRSWKLCAAITGAPSGSGYVRPLTTLGEQTFVEIFSLIFPLSHSFGKKMSSAVILRLCKV